MKHIIFFNYSDYPTGTIRIFQKNGEIGECSLGCLVSEIPVELQSESEQISIIQNDSAKNQHFIIDYKDPRELPDSIERVHVLPNHVNPDHDGELCNRSKKIKIIIFPNPDKSIVGIEMQSATDKIKDILNYLVEKKIITIEE